MQFVLTGFYQNVSEIVHQRYEPIRNRGLTPLAEPFAQLHELVIDPQKLLESIVVDNHFDTFQLGLPHA
jgi:hypothetical protein